ncbi:GAF domain-containing protein [Marinobacteraceae bacterium S3BR75-40.1]
MFKTSFERKVGLGFAIIILLLVISGASSLWFLSQIENSSLRVTGTAVPVVKGSNDVQIQLLKLAKLSSLAFNGTTEAQLTGYQQQFEQGTARYRKLFAGLDRITETDQAMSALMDEVEQRDRVYVQAVDEMLSAKLANLALQQAVEEEAEALNALVDRVGGALDNIAYTVNVPADFRDKMKEVEGNANYANQLLLASVKTIREVRDAADPDRLASAVDDLLFALRDSRLRLDAAARIFEPVDEDGLIPKANAAYDALKERITDEDNLVSLKRKELAKRDLAREKLDVADKAVSAAIANLDQLVSLADGQFSELQANVFDTLDFGFKSSLIILVVLILLASQNFHSMRKAIRRKMQDLAQLNRIGNALAMAQTQDTALEEMLQSMHRKIGVSQGSVYLINDDDDLELKAFFPPKAVAEGHKPAKFMRGEGILGRAAQTRKTIFVPNTLKDRHYRANDGEQARSLLCVPLLDKDMLLGVINLSGDVKNVSFADSDYEFVASAAQSLVTTVKNIRLRETIEEYNRTLEEKVRERTAALQQKTRDIASMMANMHQGLFTIVPDGTIHPEYAVYLESIFETKRIAHRQFSDFMFSQARLSSDEIDQCMMAVDTIVGEDEVMFEFNSHCLPTEMTLVLDGGRQKILEMDWDPILADDDTVEKLMVAVRDVTELKALEAEAARQRDELEIIGEILGVEADKFREFLAISGEFLDKCRTLIEQTPDKDPEVIATLFRNMHTVKGNARTYGLRQITDKVHQVEQVYDELRKNDEAPWEPDKLLSELEEARRIIDHYGEIFGEKLGRDAEAEEGVEIDRHRVQALLADIRDMDAGAVPSRVQQIMRDTYSTLVQVEAQPVSQVLRDVIRSVNSLAQELDKPEPQIEIDDGDIFVKREIHSTLNNVFMHVFRNAMDHGIESAEERRSKGKPEKGRISLTVSGDRQTVVMELRDDGRGIALGRVFEKAREKGLYGADAARPPASEIANLIFSSGFSTAEQVSTISGRGVGMDAVRDFLTARGGEIEIVLDPGEEQADFRTFVTRITLPGEYAVVMPHFEKSA